MDFAKNAIVSATRDFKSLKNITIDSDASLFDLVKFLAHFKVV